MCGFILPVYFILPWIGQNILNTAKNESIAWLCLTI